MNVNPLGRNPKESPVEQQLSILLADLDSAPPKLVTELLELYQSKCTDIIGGDTANFDQPAADEGASLSGDFSLDVSSADSQKEHLRAILQDHTKLQNLAKALERVALTISQSVVNPGVEETLTFLNGVPAASGATPQLPSPMSLANLHDTPNERCSGPERESIVGQLEDDFSIKRDARGAPIILGEGAMGIVVIGLPTIAGPEKAIKICTDPKHEARMLREFEVLSLLNLEGYPNAERLYRNLEGQLCYSMRRVDGESLLNGYRAFHETAGDPRREDSEARNYFENTLQVKRVAGSSGYNTRELDQAFRALLGQLIAVASAVDVMHQKGVIHRDLKPGNVRVESLTKKPIVLDFGLAKREDQKDLDSDTINLSPKIELTQDGAIMGTFPYMSPEQASGDPNAHTRATDIYALGGMLYYLMTGTPAVTQSDSKGNKRTPTQLLMLVRNGDIAPPIKLPFIKSKFQDLESICQKAMHKDPNKRYESAKEMMLDLNAWLAGNPVEAYRESVRGWQRVQYDFHHWRRSNPRKTGAIGAMLLSVPGLGAVGSAISYSQRSRANEAAVVAGESLEKITSTIKGQIKEILGSHSIESLPTDALDAVIRAGGLGRALQDARDRINTELRSSSSSVIHRYAGYEEPSRVLRSADRTDSELATIEKTLKHREHARLEMTKLLGSFRQEFTSIRDFLGNDLETRISDTSQERIDSALGQFLPSFTSAPRRSSPSDDPLPFFPDCAADVRNLVEWLESQELTADEVSTIKECVADLLSYKVLTLQRDGATDFAPHVIQYLEICHRYLEDARALRGSLTAFDYVLWWRVSGALKDKRAKELQARVAQFIDEVLTDQSAASRLSTQDLASLAKILLEQSRFEDALTLFKSMASETTIRGSSSSASLPQQYLSELGSALALGGIASEALAHGESEKSLRYAVQADSTFNRTLGTLAALPNDNFYKPMKETYVYLRIAKMQLLFSELLPNKDVFLTNMKSAHAAAKSRAKMPMVFYNIGLDLFNTGDFEGAVQEYNQALKDAPYLANEIVPIRAQCYAVLGLKDELLNDAESILAITEAASYSRLPLPSQISLTASALGLYLMNFEGAISADERQDHIELMKHLLSAVKRACMNGAPYSAQSLSLDFEFFAPINKQDPAFLDEYKNFLSSSQSANTHQ